MMENRLWCAEFCRSKGEGDVNTNSVNLDLLACVPDTASLNNDNNKCGGSALPPEVVPPPHADFHSSILQLSLPFLEYINTQAHH